MSTNETFEDGLNFAAPVPAGTVAGGPLRLGGATGLNAVALTDRAKTDVSPTNSDGTRNASYNWGGGNENGEASVTTHGVHSFPVATTTARALFDPIYIVLADNTLTTTDNSGANPLFGHAMSAKGTTAGEVIRVRIAN